MLWVDPHSFVRYTKLSVTLHRKAGNLDRTSGIGVFNRIADQVINDLPDLVLIRIDNGFLPPGER